MGKNVMTRPYCLARILLFNNANKKPLPLLILLIVNKSPFIFFLTLTTCTKKKGIYSVFTSKKWVFSNSLKKAIVYWPKLLQC